MILMLCFVFFLSGASALMFEVLWFQLSGLTFGNSIWATSIVLSSFMGGLALGNFLVTFRGHRIKSPVALYALLETIIGISGFVLVLVFPRLTALFVPLFRSFLDQPLFLNYVRAIVAFFLMLVPTTAMGISLPLLVKALITEKPDFGYVLGLLYGWNTLGATAGVIAGEAVFIKFFGVRGTGLVAAGFNVTAAALAIWFYPKKPRGKPGSPEKGTPPVFSALSFKVVRLLFASFLSGLILLALEVVWFRFMILFIVPHSLNFAIMLAVVLSGISLGGLFASKCFQLNPNSHHFIVPAFFLNGVLLILLYGNFGSVMELLSGHYSENIIMLLASLFLMLPVSFISGIIFTWLGKALHMEIGEETQATGLLTLANTIGGMMGSLTAGYILLPHAGIENTFFIFAFIYGLVAFSLFERQQPWIRNACRYVAACALVICMIRFPFGLMNPRYLDISIDPQFRNLGERRLAVREGLTETIQYFQKDLLGKPEYYRLVTNSYSMSCTGFPIRRYMKLFVYWPIALRPQSENALLICYGLGSTAKAMTDSRSLNHIDIVDISKDIIEIGNKRFPNPSGNPVYDPRARIYIEDGRFFLLTRENTYDFITAEPPPPALNGVVNLYTQEYFQLIYDRLSEGGIVTYWLPVYQLRVSEAKSILKGFCNVFENCSLWTGSGFEWMMAGIKHPGNPVSEPEFIRQWKDPVVGTEMRSLGFENPEQFGSLFIADGKRLKNWLSNSLPLIDNYPRRLSFGNDVFEDSLPDYRNFMNAADSWENLRKSDGISKVWPESMKEKSQPYFTVRETINELLTDPGMRNSNSLVLLNRCLKNPLLKNYIFWAFGSNQSAQDILAGMFNQNPAPTVHSLEIYNHLSAAAARKGDYLLAEKILGMAAKELGPQNSYGEYLYFTVNRMYFLLASGNKADALKIGQAYIDLEKDGREKRSKQVVSYWNWMVKTLAVP